MSSPKWQTLFVLQEAHESARSRNDDWKFNLNLIAGEDFSRCLGVSESKKEKPRCGRKMGYANSIDLRLRRDTFRSKPVDWTSELLGKIKDFLMKSHCYRHRDKAIQRFDLWKSLHFRADSVRGDSNAQHYESTSGVKASYAGGDDDATLMRKSQETELDDSSHGSPSVRAQARRRSARLAQKQQNKQQPQDGAATMNGDLEASDTSGMSKPAFEGDIVYETEDEDEDDDESSVVDERIRDLEVPIPCFDKIGETSRLSPRRQAENRDRSIMLREIYKALTPSQTKLGIVYVLAHKSLSGLFKVGYSTTSAAARLKQSNNCYKKDMEIIHESGERFFGALKAEKLAKTMLRNQNVHVIKCSQCAAGHIEYFEGTREHIVSVVNAMETILQADAYVLVKEVGWVLSDGWHQSLDTFSDTAFIQKMVSTARSTRRSRSYAAAREVNRISEALEATVQAKYKATGDYAHVTATKLPTKAVPSRTVQDDSPEMLQSPQTPKASRDRWKPETPETPETPQTPKTPRMQQTPMTPMTPITPMSSVTPPPFRLPQTPSKKSTDKRKKNAVADAVKNMVLSGLPEAVNNGSTVDSDPGQMVVNVVSQAEKIIYGDVIHSTVKDDGKLKVVLDRGDTS